MKRTNIKDVPRIVKSDLFLYEKYIPTVVKPYKVSFQEMYILKYIRFVLQALSGAVIFYMYNAEKDLVGYIELEKGNSRYPWAKRTDWVISPYVIKEEFRGRGYGNKILSDFVEYIFPFFNGDIYAEVLKSNTASKKAIENNGFCYMCDANIIGVRRKYKIVNAQGDYLVYKLVKEKPSNE